MPKEVKVTERKLPEIGKKVFREMSLKDMKPVGEDRILEMSFSSEVPARRWYGTEILDHNPENVDLSRMNDGGAILWNHNSDQQIGVVESAFIDPAQRKGRAKIRFGKGAFADEKLNDVSDGILRNVSVGYIPKEYSDGVPINPAEPDEGYIYHCTLWEPVEISFAPVPLDPTVGVGRNLDNPEKKADPVIVVQPVKEIKTMPEEIKVNVEEITKKAIETGQKAAIEMLGIGRKFGEPELAAKMVEEGKSVEELKMAILEKKGATPVAVSPEVGLEPKEIKSYSVVRGINALINGSFHREKSLEREASDACAKIFKKSAQGFFIPMEVQKRTDLITTTPAYGSRVIATNLLAGSFVEMLRNKQICVAMGAQVLGGLVGDVAIPGQASGATAYWLAENTAITAEAPQVFSQIALSPKTVGAYTDISRKLLNQASIDVEAFVQNDLTTVCALAADAAGIVDAGSGGPNGILASGLTTIALGGSGAVPTYAKVVALWKTVAKANALIGNLGFLTNSSAYAELMVTPKVGSTYPNFIAGDMTPNGFGSILGYKCGISEQVPCNLEKSTTDLSALIFGNFADLILAEWGTVDITVDPYTGATAGTVRVIVLRDIDVAVRHVESFAAIIDMITTSVA